MLEIINKNEKKRTPHLAVTHEAQGGPANKRKVSLVMKGIDELNSEQVEALHTFLKSQEPSEGEDEVIEKTSYQALYRKIEMAISQRARSTDRWGWAYVRDFDDSIIVYSDQDGVYAIKYTIQDDEVVLDSENIPVNEMVSWEDESGKIVLTQSDSISSDVSNLVIKSFATEKADIKELEKIFKSKYMEGKEMAENQAQIEQLTSDLEKALADKASLETELKAFKDAQEAEKAEKRKNVLKAIVAEDQLEAVQKSLESLSDTDFETVTKSMSKTVEQEEKDDLFKTVSKAAVKKEEEKTSSPMDGIIALLAQENK